MSEPEIAAAVEAFTLHGDGAARRNVIESYLPLVRHIAQRFVGRGERLEDLVQVGSIGLIAAVDRCDPHRADTLTAYVSRSVEGEIRRHLRDRCAVVRVPRRLQALDAESRRLGNGSEVTSTARAPLPLDGDEAGSVPTPDELHDLGVARALVASATRSLDRRERRVVLLRYFFDLSQSEVGLAVGVSQVHVSRLLRGAIAKMRAGVGADEAGMRFPPRENGATL
jgi:RNA polymerase sigma-B factor